MFNKILSFFSLLFLSLALTACGGGSPEKVAQQFYTATYKGDIDTVMKLIYIPASEKKPGVEDMMKGKLTMIIGEAKQQADGKGGVKKIATEKAQYNSDKTQATVKVTVTFKKDNEQVSENVKMIKDEKKQWKVNL
ncbi:MAG: DUF4878 domain-containing protein [Neisseriaceae bacterium]|nr:DUF4878 domain-containing protein [Neisseriaceae bacterium]MBQ9260219.1 DUF4878 domain-containing protein [Neisseriaceae bacterium]MBQ9620061.1 DUF4878 domain-containing protein [Neisseriaceae bacterium]MBR2251026.1 DUF4878 domain-containing protein [Neisseriaceae bacterium]MBR3424592.1 DUF4878 domain-containing protein [Neisseriaceae bacterium]